MKLMSSKQKKEKKWEAAVKRFQEELELNKKLQEEDEKGNFKDYLAVFNGSEYKVISTDSEEAKEIMKGQLLLNLYRKRKKESKIQKI